MIYGGMNERWLNANGDDDDSFKDARRAMIVRAILKLRALVIHRLSMIRMLMSEREFGYFVRDHSLCVTKVVPNIACICTVSCIELLTNNECSDESVNRKIKSFY